MKLVVGLGNPEEKYAGTRHNLGFDLTDELRRKENLELWREEGKFKAEVIKAKLFGQDIMLMRPQTYMNNSGLAVSMLANFYKIPAEDIVIIHDELDMPLGHIKIRKGGGAGGHHGVESIISSLGTDNFVRLRLGIGNGRSHSGEHNRVSFNAEHFVLEPFMPNERHDVKKMLKQALKALEILLREGTEIAQNQFN